MAKTLKSYREWLGTKLSDPERALRYLNAAAEDSEAMFLKALRKVAAAQKRSMTEIAEACNVSRESLYRMLSETGNPTSENRRAILAAMGFKSVVVLLDTPTTALIKRATTASLKTESDQTKKFAQYSRGVDGIASSITSSILNSGSARYQFVGNNQHQTVSGTSKFLYARDRIYNLPNYGINEGINQISYGTRNQDAPATASKVRTI